jgi:hypothetical protein
MTLTAKLTESVHALKSEFVKKAETNTCARKSGSFYEKQVCLVLL